MGSMHYVGLDVHKKTISYCVKKVMAAWSVKARFRRR